MREIKFRAWHQGKMWDKPYGDEWLSEGTPLNETIKGMQDEGQVLMQYTGLKDKNSVEIYEGDLLAYRGGNPLVGGYKELAGGIYKVDMDVYKYRLFRTDTKRWSQTTKGVGMIHQRPLDWEIIATPMNPLEDV